MFGQMLAGLGKLHDLGILHRDVKVKIKINIFRVLIFICQGMVQLKLEI